MMPRTRFWGWATLKASLLGRWGIHGIGRLHPLPYWMLFCRSGSSFSPSLFNITSIQSIAASLSKFKRWWASLPTPSVLRSALAGVIIPKVVRVWRYHVDFLWYLGFAASILSLSFQSVPYWACLPHWRNTSLPAWYAQFLAEWGAAAQPLYEWDMMLLPRFASRPIRGYWALILLLSVAGTPWLCRIWRPALSRNKIQMQFMCVSAAAMPTWPRNNSLCIRAFNPFLGWHGKGIQHPDSNLNLSNSVV